MLRKFMLGLAICVIGTACCGYAAAEPGSGIDTSAIDRDAPPQQDFWQFANGKWLAATPIPADRSGWDTFTALRETTQAQLRDLIEAIGPRSPGTPERKLADLYGSFMDEAGVEAAGLKGLRDELKRIHGLRDKADLPALLAHLARLSVRVPFGLDVSPDEREATRYVLHLRQGSLGLPDRDYYLKDDQHFQSIRAAYRDHIVKLLALAGEPVDAAGADAVIALETALARLQWTRVENRDPLKTYNKRSVAELAPLLSGPDDWPATLAAAGVPRDMRTLVVAQPSYVDGLGGILRELPLSTWQAYLSYNLLSAYAPYLAAAFVAEDFAFEQHTLRGVPEIQPRWKRAVTGVDRAIGFALGRLYVARYFPRNSKLRADAMIAHLTAAYRESIATLEWMGPDTRREALAKLEQIRPQIGYPASWRDYTDLTIRRDDLVGNIMRARRFEHAFWLDKLGRKVDRAEWFTTPQTVNAFYSPSRNQIVFPAGILQPPFFDAGADDAANYGAIGAVIGHEISHAFDDQGSRFDGAGNLRNWWTDQDRARFDAKTRGLVAQYDAFSPLENYHVNGALTLGENAADNAGLAIAERAYRLSLAQCPAPVLDGFSGEQRLFISFAQIWRDKLRDAARIERLKVDPHSPGRFRANGTLRNQGAFDDAFAVKPGDAMYLPPEQRILLWQTDGEVACAPKVR